MSDRIHLADGFSLRAAHEIVDIFKQDLPGGHTQRLARIQKRVRAAIDEANRAKDDG